MTAIGVVHGDITMVEVDAIVNAANSSLLGGGGVDGAIHRAAGPGLLAECRALVARQGGCDTGDAVVTGAGNLPAQWVIHTVGPVWSEDHDVEYLDRLLASCYRQSLQLADEHRVNSIAFPNISTGVFRFPKQRAAEIAIASVRATLASLVEPTIQQVLFVCFDADNVEIYEELLS